MRESLAAITEELRRLKLAGVTTVPVADETLARLRRVVGRRPAVAASRRAANAPAEAPVPPAVANPPPAPVWPREAVRPAAVPEPLRTPPEVRLPSGTKAERWAALKALVAGDENGRAHLRPGKRVVLGVGSLDAALMFVGEAPGAEEEIQGEPFVGPAGQLLTRMIIAMGVARKDVYIGNIMNWRPGLPTAEGEEQVGNRPPTAGEMAYCLPYLRAQVEVVAPRFLVALGATAAQGLLGVGAFKTLGEVRGRWHDFAGIPLMVTYHPSYILREPTPRRKRLIWEDLLKVMERAGLPVSDRQRGYFLER
ncbi:MAG: uracil-DNA glycosylase [Verrucomicrobia bacterium]|nr:uracil-DNA glycosylase [Verrucomicrobiota bacterium]